MRCTALAALALLATAGPAFATVSPADGFDNQTRLVLGVTVSGHLLISAGLEQLIGGDWSLRGELLWAPARTPNLGWQGSLTRRWAMAGGSPEDHGEKAPWGLLSVGHLQLFAREQEGLWRRLRLWHLSPGLRWGLADAGSLDLELPICWFHEKRRLMPIGLQARWQNDEPLIP
jgi:hypothetical protein